MKSDIILRNSPLTICADLQDYLLVPQVRAVNGLGGMNICSSHPAQFALPNDVPQACCSRSVKDHINLIRQFGVLDGLISRVPLKSFHVHLAWGKSKSAFFGATLLYVPKDYCLDNIF